MAEPAAKPPRVLPDAEPMCFFSLATNLVASVAPPTLHIAIIGPDTNVIFEGFRQYPGTNVLLLHSPQDSACAGKVKDAFRQASIIASTHKVPPEPYVGMIQAINAVVHESRLAYANILVNVSSGTPAAGCAALSGAYLHGLTAFHIDGDNGSILPILPLPQRALLSESDVRIITALGASPKSLATLACETRLSRERANAHIEGEAGHKGLVDLGIVERFRALGLRPMLRLTGSGRALVLSGSLASASPTV